MIDISYKSLAYQHTYTQIASLPLRWVSKKVPYLFSILTNLFIDTHHNKYIRVHTHAHTRTYLVWEGSLREVVGRLYVQGPKCSAIASDAFSKALIKISAHVPNLHLKDLSRFEFFTCLQSVKSDYDYSHRTRWQLGPLWPVIPMGHSIYEGRSVASIWLKQKHCWTQNYTTTWLCTHFRAACVSICISLCAWVCECVCLPVPIVVGTTNKHC